VSATALQGFRPFFMSLAPEIYSQKIKLLGSMQVSSCGRDGRDTSNINGLAAIKSRDGGRDSRDTAKTTGYGVWAIGSAPDLRYPLIFFAEISVR